MTMDKIAHIRALITSKGVTKAKVCERCGIHISTLSKLLSGKGEQLRPERIDRIVEYLEAVNTNEV